MFNSKRELADDVANATAEEIAITWTTNEPTAGVTQTIADGDGPDPTDEVIAITWTTNEPTAGVTQTIADGDVPTVAELGQYVANINAQHDKSIADVANLRTALAECMQYIANVNAQVGALLIDVAALRTGVNT